MAKKKAASAKATDTPLRGKELMRAVVNQILKHPETWNQTCWHGRSACGTTHCVAGWAQVLGGKPQNDGMASDDAAGLLGLNESDAAWLFSPIRTLPAIHAFAGAFIKDESFFDRNGFDRDGFDRNGFDRDGFGRDGFGRDGFDRNGFGRDGFDRNGFDRNGERLAYL